MCERFLKLNIDEEKNHQGDWLSLRYPHAFILLYFIARRARRHNGHPDGLMIGDALIGSADFEPGMSRQNFRTAVEKLVEFGYIKIISNGKKLFVDRKSTIKLTITGMLVNLCDTRIWDINPEDGNQQINQQPTNSQPTGNHKQERIRKNKNEEDKKDYAQTAKRPRTTTDSFYFNFETFEFVGITEKDFAEWGMIYPEIDLKIEIIKTINWMKSNPSKSKKTRWRKFLTNWFNNANNTAFNKKAYKAASGYHSEDNFSYADDLCRKFSQHHDGNGWRCKMDSHLKKDQKGLLFVHESLGVKDFFVALSDFDFRSKCDDFIKTKNMLQK